MEIRQNFINQLKVLIVLYNKDMSQKVSLTHIYLESIDHSLIYQTCYAQIKTNLYTWKQITNHTIGNICVGSDDCNLKSVTLNVLRGDRLRFYDCLPRRWKTEEVKWQNKVPQKKTERRNFVWYSTTSELSTKTYTDLLLYKGKTHAHAYTCSVICTQMIQYTTIRIELWE